MSIVIDSDRRVDAANQRARDSLLGETPVSILP